MDKKIFGVYLAKDGIPNNEAYAKLNLPASPWELRDAMEKVRLNEGEMLYMEIEDYEAFGYLAPYLDGLDISLNELNDLAALLSALDEVQEAAFEGLFSMDVQKKINANGGVQKPTVIMWWMPQTMLPSAGFTQKTSLSPSWTAYPTRCSRCWTSPASEE